jgi:hypothetical protein
MITYPTVYWDIINPARTRGTDKSILDYYTELHHIIPKCDGGDNSKSNLVLLTAIEHYNVHKILSNFNPGNKSLYFAWHMMAYKKAPNCHRTYMISADDYAMLQEKQSELQRGIPLDQSVKDKISDSVRELWNNNVYRVKTCNAMSIGHSGLKHSDSTKNKIRKANIGKSLDETTKRKLSEINLGYRWYNDGISEYRVFPCEAHSTWTEGRLLPDKWWITSTTCKKVIIDDISYESIIDASRSLGLDRRTVRKRVNDCKWEEWKWNR